MFADARISRLLAAITLLFAVGCGGEPPADQSGDAGPPTCEDELDCAADQDCVDGRCVSPEVCTSDLDCPDGQECVMGDCTADVGAADAADTAEDTAPVAEDAAPDIDCSGCLATTGEGDRVCVDGNHDEACGRGGAACRECPTGEYCNQGTCETSTCTPEMCDGCCVNDECKMGNTDQACGSGAETCQTCSEGASCVDGACKLPCSERCEGCCDQDGNCLGGDKDESCGSGGATCKSCGTGMECSGGGCVEMMCDQTCQGCCGEKQCKTGDQDSACGRDGEACTACEPGYACEARATGGVCVLQDDSTWDVVALRGEVPKTRKTYGQYGTKRDTKWDSFSKPDVKLSVSVDAKGGTKSANTGVVKDKLKPSWMTTTVKSVRSDDLKKADNVTLKLVDDDVLADNLIAECKIDFETSHFDGQSHQFDCKHTHAKEEITAKVWFRLKHN